MSQQYQDIYIRDNLNDTGLIPYPGRVFVFSPDIIPSGISPTKNAQQFFSSSANWVQDLAQVLVEGYVNYIYVRGMNAYNGAETGTVTLYFSTPSLLLQPSQWSQNVIPTASGSSTQFIATAANQVVVGVDAFQWNVPVGASQGHFCFIALVGTASNPAPLPTADFTSSAAYNQWLVDNPDAAQRNLTIVSNPPPPSWQQSQLFTNPDPTAEEYLFQADVSQLPAGTVVSLSCSASGPSPAINATMTVPQNSPSPNWIEALTQLPANYSSSVVLTIQIPGGSSLPANPITLEYGRVTTQKDEESLKRCAQPVAKLYPGTIHAESLQVVILGACSVLFQSA